MQQTRRNSLIFGLLFIHLFFGTVLAGVLRVKITELRDEQVSETLNMLIDCAAASEDPEAYVEASVRELVGIRGSYTLELEKKGTGEFYRGVSKAPAPPPLIPCLREGPAYAEYQGGDYRLTLRLDGGLLAAWPCLFLKLHLLIGFFLILLIHVFRPLTSAHIRRFIRSVTLQLQKLTDGEASEPMPIEDGELGELARAYNALRDSLGAGVIELRKTNTLLNSILEAMSDGVLVINEEGRLIVWTERALEFLGEEIEDDAKLMRSSEAGGDPLLAAIGSNAYMLSHLISEHFESMQAGEARTADIRLHWPRPMVLKLYLRAVEVEGRKHLLIVLHDKTRVVRLESYRRDFVANITHELKTPLTSIRGYIELLLASERSPETQEAFYRVINDEAARLADLIRDLLLLAEIENETEPPPPVETFVLPILEDCFRSLEAAAREHGVRLEHDVQRTDRLPLTREALRQVLMNLLSNAVRYNDTGDYVKVSVDTGAEAVRLIVEDDGPGIEAKHHRRIFERFYRVHTERSRELGGTGLGLSIVKHRVEAAGGEISLADHPGPGIGCRFIVRFPAASAERTVNRTDKPDMSDKPDKPDEPSAPTVPPPTDFFKRVE